MKTKPGVATTAAKVNVAWLGQPACHQSELVVSCGYGLRGRFGPGLLPPACPSHALGASSAGLPRFTRSP